MVLSSFCGESVDTSFRSCVVPSWTIVSSFRLTTGFVGSDQIVRMWTV